MTNPAQNQIEFDYTKYGFRDEENYTYKSAKGLNPEIVRTISKMKNEPEWMLQRRLKALEIFEKKPLPVTGMWANPKLAELDFQDIYYYIRPGEKSEKSWDADLLPYQKRAIRWFYLLVPLFYKLRRRKFVRYEKTPSYRLPAFVRRGPANGFL